MAGTLHSETEDTVKRLLQKRAFWWSFIDALLFLMTLGLLFFWVAKGVQLDHSYLHRSVVQPARWTDRMVLLCYALMLVFPSVWLTARPVTGWCVRHERLSWGKGLARWTLWMFGISFLVGCLGFLWEGRESWSKYSVPSPARKGNTIVVLILVDALRADHVGCYGYSRDTTPFVDKLARDSVQFSDVYAPASWTKPSVTSILTSLYPTGHGAFLHDSFLPQEAVTLPEVLQKNGFFTYAYISNPNLKRLFNYQQGFQVYDDVLMREKLSYVLCKNLPFWGSVARFVTGRKFDYSDVDGADRANNRILPVLRQCDNVNAFLYLHYMDPHFPYAPPPGYKKLFPPDMSVLSPGTEAFYDAEIRFVDEHIGKLIETMKQLGMYNRSTVILTSDHGEAFGDHGNWRHGKTIYEDQVRVPMIIKLPQNRSAGERVNASVQSVDIMPTILDLVEAEYQGTMQGKSLLPLLSFPSGESREVYIHEVVDHPDIYALRGIVLQNRWKYIHTEKTDLRDLEKEGPEELYDLQTDPKETKNLVNEKPEMLALMRDRVAWHEAQSLLTPLPSSNVSLDPETTRQLKELGYLE